MTNETTASQPKDLSSSIQQAMYQVAQRGESVERMHAAVMAVIDSQPKSIGDDAQFLDWLKAWSHEYENRLHDSDVDGITKQFASYIDSRAPAAQASAFLGLADDEGFRLALSKYNVGELTEKDFIKFLDGHAKQAAQASATLQAAPGLFGFDREELDDVASSYETEPKTIDVGSDGRHVESASAYVARFIRAALAATIQATLIYQRREEGGSWTDTTLLGKQAWDEAGWPTRVVVTIQEPVMVADGTNWKMVMDLIADELEKKSNMNEISQFTALCIEFDRRAAPMVADPAGVALEAAAEAIYNRLPMCQGHDAKSMPWKRGGNSMKQDEARRYASAALQAAATVKAVPSEALDLLRRFGELDTAHAIIEDGFTTDAFDELTVRIAEFLTAPLADKTGGGE